MPDLRVKSSYSPSPGAFGGAPGGSSAPGCGISTNPHTLSGTSITELSTDALALAARIHRLASEQYHGAELWFYRDAAWHLFPTELQPSFSSDNPIRITHEWMQPSSMEFSIVDGMGDLTPSNLESPYNYNAAGDEDPLLDEARKILLRVGVQTYQNLAASATISVSIPLGIWTGTTARLVDGVLQSYSSMFAGLHDTFAASGPNGSFEIILDFGIDQFVKHAVLRTGSKVGTCTLPAAVQPSWSNDGIEWHSLPERAVGGAGSSSRPPGDWEESYDGIAVEVPFVDMDIYARYFKFIVVQQASTTIYIDEIAVYGGSTEAMLGKNMFVGYLGDSIDMAPNQQGRIVITAADTTKKPADNNKVKLTNPYLQDSTGAIELADIAYNLFTNAQYWVDTTGYGAPLSGSEIGWALHSGYTSFTFPLWQGQGNSIIGYAKELFNTIGWDIYSDYNGVLQARDPAFTQVSPDRVLIANIPGGVGDVRQCVRHFTGKQMRNAVEINSGRTLAAGSGFTRKIEPNSITRYGERTTSITDPIAITPVIRDRIGDYFIRDYAWNLQTLDAEFAPTFDTDLRQIFAINAPARGGALYAAPSTVSGYRRKREYWGLWHYTDIISVGEWKADAVFHPYFPQGPDSPDLLSIDPGTPYSGGTLADIVLHYTAVTNPRIVRTNVYKSTTSEHTGFVLIGTATLGSSSLTIVGESTAANEWFYMTNVDVRGIESVPSVIIKVLPGSAAFGPPEYLITDLTVSFVSRTGPDTQGYYTYQFSALWTSPPGGFTQNRVYCSFDSVPGTPLNPASWPITKSEWHWWAPDRIPAGREWDRVTIGQLNATWKMRLNANMAGHTLYWRFWNSTATRSWHPVASNIASCVIV